MFPIFLWVKKYKNLENFKINLDNNYDIKLEIDNKILIKTENEKGITIGIKNIKTAVEDMYIKELKIKHKRNNVGKKFYGKNIDQINILLGKNGTGKTSILEVMSLFSEGNRSLINKMRLLDVEHLIIYNTENENEFILEGYTPYQKKDYFSCIEGITKYGKVGYYSFSIDNNNKFIGDREEHNSAIARIKFDLEIEKYIQKEIFKNSIYRKSKVHKINYGIKDGTKEDIYNYVIGKKDKNNYKNFYMKLGIAKRSHYYDEITLILDSVLPRMDEFISTTLDNLYLYKYNDNCPKKLLLKEYCNYLYQYEIYSNIKGLSNFKKIIEIINKINSDYKEKLEKIKIEDCFHILLEELSGIENIEELEKNILEIGDELEKNYNEKIIEEIKNSEIDFFIKEYKIKVSLEYFEKIKGILQIYDHFMVGFWDYGLETNDIEKCIYITEGGMSNGEEVKLYQFALLNRIIKKEFYNKRNITFLFDEPETSLHPEWCRTLIYEYINELEHYKNKNFKLIYATHSPFLLGDILTRDIICLDKDRNRMLNNKGKIKTFGGNIYNLLKDEMFMNSTLGEFSKMKIRKALKSMESKERLLKEYSEIEFLINEIGESLIANKLKNILESKIKEIEEKEDEEFYLKKIEQHKKEIEKYKNKLNQLKS